MDYRITELDDKYKRKKAWMIAGWAIAHWVASGLAAWSNHWYLWALFIALGGYCFYRLLRRAVYDC